MRRSIAEVSIESMYDAKGGVVELTTSTSTAFAAVPSPLAAVAGAVVVAVAAADVAADALLSHSFRICFGKNLPGSPSRIVTPLRVKLSPVSADRRAGSGMK